ncbi:hypothetical protein [Nostoc sp.]|uniref:hypothetical protein n=1 Tax=Nostoc sp. TaxID=1180 RepID=UPI002FFB3F61
MLHAKFVFELLSAVSRRSDFYLCHLYLQSATFPTCVVATTPELFISDRYKFLTTEQYTRSWAITKF